MKQNQIKVLMVAPREAPQVVTLTNTLDALQKAVSIGSDYQGLIELFSLEADVSILCNEEGKIIGLAPNRRLGQDILCGVFYVTGNDDEGNLTSLTDEQLAKYSALFWHPDTFEDGDVDGAVFMQFFPL